MKELAKLLAKGTQGEWSQDIINIANETFGISAENDDVIASCGGDNGDYNAQLIAAMHNHLPELLDAWEMAQKIDEWAKTPSGIQSDVTLGGYQYAQFDVEKMIRQWRDGQKNERVE